jgi:crotonobetainyl-CoA:carnitine CoA-transferase CaiB-like acyl-CoA transferase
MTNSSATRRGPLHGVRIVDLSSVIIGPYATQVMADFGADVIKIKSPDRDIMRFVAKHDDRGTGPIHLTLNRGKSLMALDLKKPEELGVVKKLIARADAFVHAMRPKAIAPLESARAIKKDIVYCGAYGAAANGPYGDDPAYDDMTQGLCGTADLGARLADEPRFFPTVIADKVCGLTLAYSLLVALMHRQHTSKGQQVEVPMFDSMVQFLMVEHRTLGPNEEIGYASVLSQLRKPHRPLDGYVSAPPYHDKNWRDFFMLVERPDLANDARFISHNTRTQNYEVLYGLLGTLIAELSARESCARRTFPSRRYTNSTMCLTTPLTASGLVRIGGTSRRRLHHGHSLTHRFFGHAREHGQARWRRRCRLQADTRERRIYKCRNRAID